MTRRQLPYGSLMLLVLVGATTASADIINFETYSGSSVFGASEQTLTILGTSAGTVTISGGVVLTNETNLPADETSVYGTCGICLVPSYLQTITLTFQDPITNFFLDLYNGQTSSDTFTAADNVGDSVTEVITANTASGNALISFPAAGTLVTITTADPNWDFSIDNVGFNQATPGVPEPGTITLLAAGLIGIVALGWHRGRRAGDGAYSLPLVRKSRPS